MVKSDFLIIGGGVIGCSLARELARAGQQVIVLDQRHAGAGASSRAAGLLAPMFGKIAVDPLTDLCFESSQLYPSWVDELREQGLGDIGFRRAGLLELLGSPALVDECLGLLPILTRPGRRAEILNDTEVRRREPALAGAFTGGLLFPDDAMVDPDKLATQIARAAELAGARLHEHEQVAQCVRGGDRIAHVDTSKERYQPGNVIVAAGAWSGRLFEPLGVHLPTRPVKGQLLTASCRVSPVRAPTSLAEALFVPRDDGSLTLGVTVEEVGFDEESTLAGIAQIIQQTRAVVPAIAGLPLTRAWAGLRPATPDGLPYMGPVPPLRNLWVSAGHFRKGILLAPLCAKLMARSVLADHLDEALEPFKPSRHGLH